MKRARITFDDEPAEDERDPVERMTETSLAGYGPATPHAVRLWLRDERRLANAARDRGRKGGSAQRGGASKRQDRKAAVRAAAASLRARDSELSWRALEGRLAARFAVSRSTIRRDLK